jgi:group I intron endonuclease
MRICKVLLKHDLDNFSLSILEYCEPGQCLEREDYYIKLLKPEYNILQKAGSSLGIKR